MKVKWMLYLDRLFSDTKICHTKIKLESMLFKQQYSLTTAWFIKLTHVAIMAYVYANAYALSSCDIYYVYLCIYSNINSSTYMHMYSGECASVSYVLKPNPINVKFKFSRVVENFAKRHRMKRRNMNKRTALQAARDNSSHARTH